MQWVATADRSKGWFVRRMMQMIDTTVLRHDSSWIHRANGHLTVDNGQLCEKNVSILWLLPKWYDEFIENSREDQGAWRMDLQRSLLFLWWSWWTKLIEEQRRMNIQEADAYEYLSLSRTRSTTTAKDSLRRADDKELKTQETAQQTLWRNMTTSYQYWPTLMLREICALQVTVSGPTGCILDNKARHLTRINIRGERGDGGKLTRWIMDLPRASTYTS